MCFMLNIPEIFTSEYAETLPSHFHFKFRIVKTSNMKRNISPWSATQESCMLCHGNFMTPEQKCSSNYVSRRPNNVHNIKKLVSELKDNSPEAWILWILLLEVRQTIDAMDQGHISPSEFLKGFLEQQIPSQGCHLAAPCSMSRIEVTFHYRPLLVVICHWPPCNQGVMNNAGSQMSHLRLPGSLRKCECISISICVNLQKTNNHNNAITWNILSQSLLYD